MSSLELTSAQQDAVVTSGKSVLVSAAAGSGKTAVLAERCAHLVCDAPQGVRCHADELLVLTFTEAAASEMRSRIVDAIRRRLDDAPDNDRLREETALVDAAQISTIHAFCLWMIRRWFSQLDIDPTASVLDEQEARILKGDVLDALFDERFEAARSQDDPLGAKAVAAGLSVSQVSKRDHDRDDDPKGGRAAFLSLIDAYGLGSERSIAQFLLRLHDFVASLPDPDRWLTEAVDRVADRSDRSLLRAARALSTELAFQIEHARRLANHMDTAEPVEAFCAGQILAYVDQLETWAQALGSLDSIDDMTNGHAPNDEASPAWLTRFDNVCAEIGAYEFSRKRGPRRDASTDAATGAAQDAARAALKDVKDRLFKKRLTPRFGLFSVAQWREGLQRIAPHVRTITSMVRDFDRAYTKRKRERNVLDFADLERLAFDLLMPGKDGEPSAVARSLHRRFAHVLVDEFQDINPIQLAIIHAVSRESDPSTPSNLFVVGDIKQSIYGFRLAEPQLFAQWVERVRADSIPGRVIALQENFRSRPTILSAVNVVFRQLMGPGSGRIVYDDDAALVPGRAIDSAEPSQPVEFHLVERTVSGDETDDDDPEAAHAYHADASRWSPIEREAYVIAGRIRDWMGSDALRVDGRPLQYTDIAVLLRTRKQNADRVAGVLTLMGIPAFADAGGSLFAAREIREVLAALTLMDNAHQDIPLASVMRSGILSEPFSADALARIRCHDRTPPFHEVVRAYARDGADDELRTRVAALLTRLERLRTAVRRRPLADVLMELYDVGGYLAYVGGLPNGALRRANLLKLHDLTRRFSAFRRQGLYRFLEFIRSLEDNDQVVSSAAIAGGAEDAVRVSSIHQAKGLEFPVVFVAGLGGRFNLKDAQGRMIFERNAGVGLRVVDTDRMVEYPSLIHMLVAADLERDTREEELRVLYVAMTRARDKLVLVGSRNNVADAMTSMKEGAQHRKGQDGVIAGPSRLTINTAQTPLDWLVPAIGGAPKEDRAGVFDVRAHTSDEISGWRIGVETHSDDAVVRRAVARCEALPPDEPTAPDDPDVAAVFERIDFVYPHLPATSVRATMAASERSARDQREHGSEKVGASRRVERLESPASRYATSAAPDAADRGIATHRVLEHLDFAAAASETGIASEWQRMLDAGILSREALALVDRDAIAWFATTPLSDAVRRAGPAYRREFMFVSTEPLDYVDPSLAAPAEDRVLVRGIVDGVLPRDAALEIIDFKTDDVAAADVEQHAARYGPQLERYVRALSSMRRPVRAAHLVFLSPRRIVDFDVGRDDAGGPVISLRSA